jgi:ubiquinone/menaquinone biosynthesis C-methylase UbiE
VSTTEAAEADRALKAKHRAMWALGNYPVMASDLISDLGKILVQACAVGPGDRVLDVAAGSGNVAIPAALTGASVIASDLTPELFEAGRRQASEQGAELEWREADAEALPFADNEFDKVISCVGVMFAPHHQPAADELVRVCRPGGMIGLISWTPEGFIGRLFATMRPYVVPPPPGVQPPPLWGNEEHVRSLFAERITDLDARRQMLRVELFHKPEDFRDFYKTNFGPTIAAYKNVADDPEQVAALDRDLVDLARDGVEQWEYLLVTARKSG